MDVVFKAARVAAHYHRNQFREHPDAWGILRPAIEHPARVAAYLELNNRDLRGCHFHPRDLVAAAWLHDALEATALSREILEELFPDCRVPFLVDAVTDPDEPGVPRAERWRKARERLRRYGPEVHVLTAADRIDDLRDARFAPDDFKRRYAEESRLLLAAIPSCLPAPIANDFNQAIRRLEESAASPPVIVEPEPA